MDPHRLAELRSLALHRAIAERLVRDPVLVTRARQRVIAWGASGLLARLYRDAWLRVLEGPADELLALLTDDGEHAREMRQATPFAGVIPATERWKIWRSVRDTA